MDRIERKAMERKASEALKTLFDRLTNDEVKPLGGQHPLGSVKLAGITYEVSITFMQSKGKMNG